MNNRIPRNEYGAGSVGVSVVELLASNRTLGDLDGGGVP
jgi:hypothetical protein